MSDQLKPCPFCGVEPISDIGDPDINSYIMCVNDACPIEPGINAINGPAITGGFSDSALITAWNTRHTTENNHDQQN